MSVKALIENITNLFEKEKIEKLDYGTEFEPILNEVMKVITARQAIKSQKISTKSLFLSVDDFYEMFWQIYTSTPSFVINDEFFEEENLDNYWEAGVSENLMSNLKQLFGFSIEITSDGEHEHDGTDVDYTIVFTSPKGLKTIVETKGNLAIGLRSREVKILM